MKKNSLVAVTTGLAAGALAALTPVAALMFRFDNPDAMLTILMAAAAYFVTRAIETERGRQAMWWMVAAGAAIGEFGSFFMLHPETFGASIASGYTNPLAGYVAGRGGVLGAADAEEWPEPGRP